MTIGFGQVAASDINAEFGRGGQMGIYEARNGYYGAVNDRSGYRPTANGQSGYEYDDWRGYNGYASRPYVYCFLQESAVDVNMRFYMWNVYGGNYLSEAWFYGGTGPWTEVADNWGVTLRAGDTVQVYWHWFGWGYYYESIYVAIYSPSRGNIYYQGCTPAGYDYIYQNTILSGETWYCYGVDYYC